MAHLIKTRPALLIELSDSDGTTDEVVERISYKTGEQVVLDRWAAHFSMFILRITGYVGAVRVKDRALEYALTEKGEKRAKELREFFMRFYNLK